MAKGIVVKVWNVNAGSRGRSTPAQMSSSVDYIFNDEKCALEMSGDSLSQMGRELHYVVNDLKTLEGLYVSGRHIIDLDHAVDEMIQVKEYYGKNSGRLALHGTISLDAEESDPKNAGKLMELINDLMAEIFPNHQCVFAVHTNTDNLHIHFIVNTVALDGKKIHMEKSFMKKEFQPAINRLAKKYGFTPNEEWGKEQKSDIMPIKDRKIFLRKKIDLAIEESEDFDSFVKLLREEGITVNVGKYISLKNSEMARPMRTYQLGKEYSVDAIRDRIRSKRYDFVRLEMEAHIKGVESSDVMLYTPRVVKKYKDMSEEEKREAVKMLRMGKNPWRIVTENNWQMKKVANELSMISKLTDIVRFYAPVTHEIKDAKSGIVARQKSINEEMKAIRENLKHYKVQIDLYHQMHALENRAFLYEVADCKEYETEYLEYKELSKRLENHYGKTIEEVAVFYEDQMNQLAYGKAQREELSEQYKAVTHFERSNHRALDESVFLFDAVGHSKAKLEAGYGVFASRLVYITADDNSQTMLRVMTTPDVIDGKNTVTTTVSVLNADGEVLEEFTSKEMSAKEFNKAVNDVKYEYGFYQCHIHESELTGADALEEETIKQAEQEKDAEAPKKGRRKSR